MSEVRTDEEQVEALKKWWDENGKSLVIGLVVGLGAVGGWKFWQDHTVNQARDASLAFEQVQRAAADPAAGAEEVVLQAERVRQNYPSSVYASLASLAMASAHLELNDTAAARAELETVVNNAGRTEMRELARIRLARLLLSNGDHDAAQSVLGASPTPGFEAAFAEVQGDLYRARGEVEQARVAYITALAAGSESKSVVEMKLDDLGLAGSGNE